MASPKSTVPEGVPAFAVEHAPLVHLFKADPYRPSDPAATLAHTRPQINYKDVPVPSPPLTLANLDQLNSVGSNGGNDVYLTSYEDITKDPAWLKGLNAEAEGKKTGVIFVVEKDDGVVDVFYFYFFAFNWGGVVLDKQLGDHVGDWEHIMIRFVKGEPKYVWLSQHANGEAYTFSALKKDASGRRPIVYCANGSHAIFATPGTHDHTIPNVNLPFRLLLVDETDDGPIHDPVTNSYYYTLTPSLRPYDPTTPTAWLNYKGRWGDQEIQSNDHRQDDLFGNKKYVGGPTGPLDKQLMRKEVWPENSSSKGQFIRTKLGPGMLDAIKAWAGKLQCLPVGKKKGGEVKKILVSGEEVK